MLIRVYVGLIFIGEGVLKFVRPDALGPGRFIKAGIPAGAILANFDGLLEIGCGLLILVGLATRLATLPMIADMLGALAITKVPLLWGDAPLYPKEGGFWDFFHEGRLEVAMLCGCVYLLIAGRRHALGRCVDEPRRRRAPCPDRVCLGVSTAFLKVDSGTVARDRK